MQGVRSSRVIERLRRRDVAFRIVCAGDAPNHVTISRFRAEAAGVMEQLSAQVLMLCARLGMGHLGVVAIDSVKISADASLAANRTETGLRELAAAAAAEHAATDAAAVTEAHMEHQWDTENRVTAPSDWAAARW